MTASTGQGGQRSRLRLGVALLLAVWLGTRLAAPPQQPLAVVPLPSVAALAALASTAPSLPVVVALGCHPVDQLFARMFSGLTDAAMLNAGIDRQDVLNATAADRATLKRYLGTLGVAADDAQLDALLGGQLPDANLGGPFAPLGTCVSLPSPSGRGK
jgi:hypothetical protein